MAIRFQANSEFLALSLEDRDSLKTLAVDLGSEWYSVTNQDMTLLSAAALEFLFVDAIDKAYLGDGVYA